MIEESIWTVLLFGVFIITLGYQIFTYPYSQK